MLSFFKEHGYVWETGLTGHLTYAPQGKKVKNNLENYLRHQFTLQGFSEVETPLIFRQEVWEQSGHWDKFQDPIIRTTKNKTYRLDHLLEEAEKELDYVSLSIDEIWDRITKINQQRSADDQLIIPDNRQIEMKSLMMRSESGHQAVGLRPETATATYFHYSELMFYHNQQFPLSVFQIGKSFRNEVSPGRNLLRGREFTQAEFQVILPSDLKNQPSTNLQAFTQDLIVHYSLPADPSKILTAPIQELPTSCSYYTALMAMTYQLFMRLGLQPAQLRLRQHAKKEMAFYALDSWDLEVNLKEYGWTEVAGLHDRGDYDLNHTLSTGNTVTGDNSTSSATDSSSTIPHILEIAIGIDRLFYAILDNLYEEKTLAEGKSIWRIPYFLATTQVSVLPLVKNKPPIVQKAQQVYQSLRTNFSCEYAEKASIGKRYLRNARRGIPYSVTIDFQTLEDETVTLRDRDTEKQERVSISDLTTFLFQRIHY